MKTNIYNKEEHIEGYVGSDEKESQKSAVQKKYEAGNEGNEVTSYGKETLAHTHKTKDQIKIRDGFDNTGTQGKDSLSDDAYNSADKHPTIESAESHTGSSSKDFEHKHKSDLQQRDEDEVLYTGI
ncbi:hypothetical protein ACFOG5_20215 [Pedobacter fastidiosus]|uniref:Uncharacterized protein n=1 Tax=Pedobacter fastidiosus TaxID=2765361 RepID=A0ABR7KVF8_9SPHI|nr:hypothetical protein [Pedobacter fastidiosus]MBC6111683.1 hypothetical protein [Pedobacter fastidiosus]